MIPHIIVQEYKQVKRSFTSIRETPKNNTVDAALKQHLYYYLSTIYNLQASKKLFYTKPNSHNCQTQLKQLRLKLLMHETLPFLISQASNKLFNN
uniref:Putative ovule protein n=1 Tax=Solanum chacoense TaxID=4108 RepID=A0A0V0H3K2_SOLCH